MIFGFFFPGDFLLLAAGILAGSYRDVTWIGVAITAAAASFVGAELGFVIGKRFGFVLTRNNNPPSIESSIERSKKLLSQNSWSTIIFSNFVPGIRTFVPVIAGQSSINRAKFAAANGLGSIIWASAITLIGYELASINVIRESPFVVVAGLFLLSSGASLFTFFRAL
jgi:membrane-associated protein